VGAARSVGV